MLMFNAVRMWSGVVIVVDREKGRDWVWVWVWLAAVVGVVVVVVEKSPQVYLISFRSNGWMFRVIDMLRARARRSMYKASVDSLAGTSRAIAASKESMAHDAAW